MRATSDPEREAVLRQEIARALREARQQANLTQAQVQARLAVALGVETVPPMLMSRLENGARAPSLGVLDALCEVLGAGEGALLDALQKALKPRR